MQNQSDKKWEIHSTQQEEPVEMEEALLAEEMNDTCTQLTISLSLCFALTTR